MSESKDDFREVHPLDREDNEPEYRQRPVSPNADRVLLKWSVRLAGSAAVIVAVASAVTAAAQPLSAVGNIADGVFRVAAGAALLGCCGILLAYRIPQVSTSLSRSVASVSSVRRSSYYHANGFAMKLAGLIGSCGLFLIVIWGLWAALAIAPFWAGLAYQFLNGIGLILAGLSVTMIVFHTGYLRAFGIGFIAVSALQVQSFSMYNVLQFSGGFGSNGIGDFMFSQVLGLTLAIVSGLVSAIYAGLLLSKSTPANRLTDESNESNDS